MSSYITCQLEIKNIDTLKQVLDIIGVKYQEGNLEAKGYGNAKSKVDLLIPQNELRKINAGRYGDIGFKYNKATETYDIMLDDNDMKVVNNIKRTYALETIKKFATSNRKEYRIVEATSQNEIVIDVFI